MSILMLALAVGLALLLVFVVVALSRLPTKRPIDKSDAPLIIGNPSIFAGDSSSSCGHSGSDGGACDGGSS
jgi:hypothetical protein